MERAQKLESAAGWNQDDTTGEVAASEAPRESANAISGRGLMIVLGLQVVTLAALAAGVMVTRDLLNDVRHEAATQSDAVQQQIAAITTQTQGVQNEVSAVRQMVASRTGEDVVFLKIMVLKPNIDPELARRIAHSVHHYCDLYRRDPDLVLAIMTVESDFNPKAVSSVGALGLMQVMPHWKKVLGIQGDLREPDVGIQYGLQVLGFYQEMYKDLDLALTAYNRGPGPVDNALVKGKDPRNDYAPRVLAVYQRLKKLNASPETL